jgi:hypothetical protein
MALRSSKHLSNTCQLFAGKLLPKSNIQTTKNQQKFITKKTKQ